MTRQSLGTLAAVVLLALVAVGAVSLASAVQTEARVRAEMRDSVAFVAASAFRASRDSMEVLRAATLAAERKLAKVRTDARGTLAVTGRVIDSLRTVPVTDTTALPVALAAYDSLAAAFRAYLAADAIAHDAADRERAGLLTTLSKADTALAEMTQARDAWREAATCRTVFRIPCPTRTQAFVAGALVTAAVVVGVRR